MQNIQVRGCCCGIPFGCSSLFLLAGFLFLWKLLVPDMFDALPSAALYGTMATAGAGLVLSVRAGRPRR